MGVSRWKTTVGVLLLSFFAIIHLGNSDFVGVPTSQRDLDRVPRLPGQHFEVSFNHYSGFINVDEKSGKNLFYWFFEASGRPDSKPLILWLNGGPGCSSIAYGEAEEIGSFRIRPDGKTVYLNPHSWNQVANILFIDSPVGVGFSYSSTSSDLLHNGDKSTAQDSLDFLLKWFERFPEHKKQDFYIAGESYAGHYVPQLCQAIVRHNRAAHETAINLKGCMVGNALLDDYHDRLGIFEFMWTMGLISDQTFKLLNHECDKVSLIHSSKACDKAMELASNEVGNIDLYSIFSPPCFVNASQSKMLLKRMSIGQNSDSYDPCTALHTTTYFNLPEVQKALHVLPQRPQSKWETCSDVVGENWKDSPKTVLDVYHELISVGVRVWIFSGNADGVLPTASTRHSIEALKLQTISPYRAWYDDEGQVGGWRQEYKGMTLVVMRGAGHEVPRHKPKLALALIKGFLSATPLRSAPDVSEASPRISGI